MDGLRSSLEDNGIAGFEAQGRCIHRHIGTGFIDETDNAQRDSYPSHQQAVGTFPHARVRSHRIGQGRNFPESIGHGADHRVI